MAIAALELNDASLAIAREGEVLLAGPGHAAMAGGGLRFGDEARSVVRLNPRQAHRRYWAELSDAPLLQPIGACRTSADLVHEHLSQLWARCNASEGIVLAVMPGWSGAQLGLLLGIARDIGMPVTGLVDAAVAASRKPWPGRVVWHLQAGLDSAWLTRIEQENGGATLGTREPIERFGIDALERGCSEFLARRFVECSRFDPLHDARSEQQLYDQLPGWLLAAARLDRIDLELDYGGNHFAAWVGAADLRECIGKFCEPLTQKLRALISPREPSVLQVHGRFADFPGVIEALLRLPACTVVLLEPGAAARGALRLRASGTAAAAGLRVTTSLPWDQPPQNVISADSAATALAPTHIAFEGCAWRLAGGPVHIGTGLAENEHGIRLDGRSQAVSRRHCTIQIEDGRVMVHDQSRYGTLLNGHRIDGSAVLQAGDVLRIGQPPLEFTLIAEVGRGP